MLPVPSPRGGVVAFLAIARISGDNQDQLSRPTSQRIRQTLRYRFERDGVVPTLLVSIDPAACGLRTQD